MTIRNPYVKGHVQVSAHGNFIRIADTRYIRTKKGTICVSSNRGKNREIVDDLSLLSVIAINGLTKAIKNNQPITVKSIAGRDTIKFNDERITVCLSSSRQLIPLDLDGTITTIKIRRDYWTTEESDKVCYLCLYRVNSEKTPAVKIAWTKA